MRQKLPVGEIVARRRADSLINGEVVKTPVHILISDDTKAGEIVLTIEDLKQLGIRSYSISVQ